MIKPLDVNNQLNSFAIVLQLVGGPIRQLRLKLLHDQTLITFYFVTKAIQLLVRLNNKQP